MDQPMQQPMSAADVAAARAVLAWAKSVGVTHLPGRPRTWVSADRQRMLLRLGPGVALDRLDKPTCILHAASVTEMLSMLAALQVIPARFSSLGRLALAAHAEACFRHAQHLIREHGPELATPAGSGWLAAWQEAADSARRLARSGTV
jgi:hypothetical protein